MGWGIFSSFFLSLLISCNILECYRVSEHKSYISEDWLRIKNLEKKDLHTEIISAFCPIQRKKVKRKRYCTKFAPNILGNNEVFNNRRSMCMSLPENPVTDAMCTWGEGSTSLLSKGQQPCYLSCRITRKVLRSPLQPWFRSWDWKGALVWKTKLSNHQEHFTQVNSPEYLPCSLFIHQKQACFSIITSFFSIFQC